jgi:hypothetical protein
MRARDTLPFICPGYRVITAVNDFDYAIFLMVYRFLAISFQVPDGWLSDVHSHPETTCLHGESKVAIQWAESAIPR